MIRRLVRWFALVLPPRWTVIVFAVCYLVALTVDVWTRWIFASAGVAAPAGGFSQRCGIVCFGCAAYGCFRAVAFHPRCRQDYCQWLATTPWTVGKPLPLGPVHLVVQDVVLLGLALLLICDVPLPLAHVTHSFLIPYLVVLAAVTRATGLLWIPYLLLFGMGLAIRLGSDTWFGTALMVSLCLPAHIGLRASLARFPWHEPSFWMDFAKQAARRRDEGRETELGWPFDRLKPRRIPALPSQIERVLVSLLYGWLVYAVTYHVPERDGQAMLLSLFGLACLAGCFFGRLVTYCQYHRPPISLLGRIGTFRWIIPAYDRVFVAPVCVLLVAFPLTSAVVLVGVPLIRAVPAASSLMMLVALLMGPPLQSWQLTAPVRLVLGWPKATEFSQL